MRQERLQHNGYIVINGLHNAALFAARPYLSLIAADFGASVMVVGFITSLYSVSQVLWAMPLGRLLDRRGTRPVARCGAAAFLLAVLGLTFAGHLAVITLCAILLGLSHVTLLLSVQNMLTAVCDQTRREHYIGMISFSASAGAFSGPLLGGYLRDTLGSSRGFLGAAGLGLLCLLLTLVLPVREQTAGSARKASLGGLLRNSQIMRPVLVSGAVLFATEVTMSYLPLYCAQIGISALTIGSIMSVKGIAQMIIRPFLKTLVQLFRRERLLTLCLLLGGLCLAAYGLVHASWLFFVVAGLAGLSIGLALPLTLLAVSLVAPPDQRSQVLALRIMGNYLGQSMSPLIFGLIGQLAGLAPVFWLSGLVMAISTTILRPQGSKRKGGRTPPESTSDT